MNVNIELNSKLELKFDLAKIHEIIMRYKYLIEDILLYDIIINHKDLCCCFSYFNKTLNLTIDNHIGDWISENNMNFIIKYIDKSRDFLFVRILSFTANSQRVCYKKLNENIMYQCRSISVCIDRFISEYHDGHNCAIDICEQTYEFLGIDGLIIMCCAHLFREVDVNISNHKINKFSYDDASYIKYLDDEFCLIMMNFYDIKIDRNCLNESLNYMIRSRFLFEIILPFFTSINDSFYKLNLYLHEHHKH